MGCKIQKSNPLFSFSAILESLSILFTVFFLISCAQNSPDIKQGELSVIYEYADEENYPSARLCVFVESESDSRRSGLIQVSTQKDGFIWNSDALVRIKNGEHYWTGYTNFVMQKNEPFPLDSYRILLQNSDEKEVEEILLFDYDTSFYELNALEAEDKIEDLEGIKKIAVYDEAGILLYYGDLKDSLSSSRKIWNTYPKANYYTKIWQAADSSVICILPKELVLPDEND